jgi:hypothetical protein
MPFASLCRYSLPSVTVVLGRAPEHAIYPALANNKRGDAHGRRKEARDLCQSQQFQRLCGAYRCTTFTESLTYP